jgi:hypothetical protein
MVIVISSPFPIYPHPTAALASSQIVADVPGPQTRVTWPEGKLREYIKWYSPSRTLNRFTLS